MLKDKLLWASALGLVLSGGLLVLGAGYLALVVYTGLATGTPLVGVLLDIAVPVLGGVTLLFVLLVASGAGVAWALVRNASVPRSERLARLAERAEREYSPLRMLGLSELLAPPEPSAEEQAEQALESLKQQYVDGELSEIEFERRVDRLVSNESLDEARAAREHERAVERESRRN